jgi:hypothetical protein
MPLRKKVGYYGLRDLSYSIVDTSENSPNFFRVIEFPEKLKAGKNLIKLAANRDNLVNNSEIQIEILDYNGNPIYYEPLRYIEKDGTRVIAIYVYPDTSPGECVVYLAGRAQFDPATGTNYSYSQNSNDANFLQVPNLIWSRTCNIAPNAANDVEIIFTQYPRVTISEIIQPYLQPVDRFNVFTQVSQSGNTATVTATATLNNSSTLTGTQTAAVGNIGQGAQSGGTPSYGKQYFNTSITQNSLASTTSTTTISPILQTLNGYSVITTAQPFFSASMTNGRLTIVNPQIAVVSSTAGKSNLIYPGQQFDETTFDYVSGTRSLSGSYEFAITQVINSTTARIAQIAGFADLEYDTLGSFSVQLKKTTSTTTSTRSAQSYETYIVNRIEPTSNFTASYIQPTLTIQTENSSSFADIILSNIEPATGDVYRIKTLFKPSGQFGDFIDLGDSILERTDVLIDTQSLETNITVGAYYENFGIFENLAEINQYWTGSALGTISTSNPLTVSYNVDTLIGGAQITPTTTAFQNNDAAIFSIKPQYYQQLYAGTEYIIVFNIATDPNITSYTTTNANIPNPRLDVYISGSDISKQDAFTRVTTGNVETVTNFNSTLIGDFQDNGRLGTRIGTYETTNVGGTVATVTFRFVAEENGPFDLKFVTRRGSFILGDIQVLANKETGFSPNYVRINKRIPTEHLNTPLTFKFQFFNFRGDKADVESVAYGAIFDGDNTYIDGTNNLITGSIFISNQIGSGMEIAGTNSGFMRSVGYEGFISASNPAKGGAAGWMIWSGSVLPQSGDNYGGVGLELVADADNYLQYRTYPSSVFIVKAETFFLGSSSQYLSGSNGNIEISSSNFHLTAQGNVTASNALFTGVALANIIRDKTVVITAANSGSYFDTYDYNSVLGGNQFAYWLRLDGNNGGEQVRRVTINCDLLYPLGKISFPQLGNNARVDIVIENNVAGNQILDIFNVEKGTITNPAVVTLPAGAVMQLASVFPGTSQTDWNCIGGSIQPFSGYTYKRGVIVTGSLEVTGSLIMNNNKQFNHGAFSSTATQTLPGANQSASFQYDTIDVTDGVTYNNNSRIQFPNDGVYNIQFSAQIEVASNAQDVYIWLKKNGSNIANTATRVHIDKANASAVAAWNWIYPFVNADYAEIAWQSTDSAAELLAEAASGNIPAIPSVIVTVTQVA